MEGRTLSKEDEATLREIIRSVDKRLDYSISDAGGAKLLLHLATQGWEGTTSLRLDDLRTAKTDRISRNKIRLKIKGLKDHMWDRSLAKDVLGTKAANMLKKSSQSEDGFSRPFMRRSPKR